LRKRPRQSILEQEEFDFVVMIYTTASLPIQLSEGIAEVLLSSLGVSAAEKIGLPGRNLANKGLTEFI